MTKPEQQSTQGSPGLSRRFRPLKPPIGRDGRGWRRTAIASGLAAALLLPTLVVQQAAAEEIDTQAAPIETIPGQPNTIWFDEPLPTTGDAQRQWENRALPIGNGALGAVVYGGVADEKLQLNEKSLWTGGPGSPGGYNYGNWTDNRGPEDMQAVRDLITNSPTKGIPAATVAQKLGQPKLNFGAYQTFGELKLDMSGLGEATNYRRALDIGQSIVTTTFTSNGVNYTREYFATAADDVIVMRITADQPGKVGFTARLDLPGGRSNVSNTAADGRITTSGTLNNQLRFESQVQVIAENGTRTQDAGAGRVTVANADSALVVFGAATDYSLDYSATYRNGVNPHEPVTATVNAAVAAGFGQLKDRHIADYSSLYDRANLDLGAELPNIPTDELLAKYRGTIDPASARALEALFFQYGRYLLISSSRDGSLPANLQGVWNRSNNPPWDSDYHVNINLQMNYWPAETTDLSETTGPFFDYVDSMVAPGTVTASSMYGARGWVTGNETNVYGFTGLHQYPESFWQPDAAAWLSQHYYEHYLFTKDEAFLRDRAYPMMKSISQFWFDFLVVDPRDGSLVVSPSYSPEQGEFSAGASISQELVWSLLSQTSQAAETLGESDATFLAELRGTLENLDPGLRIGSWGQLQEWKEDWDQKGNQHRHVSHLVGLFPGNQISPAETPELAAAAKVSLNERGDGGTGWSKAWKINFWARLLDGDRSHKMLSEQLKGSTLDNLWDDHPPFQIDGNFGATSGIAEMLLQSHTDAIDVLPALPSAWPTGSYSGLKARGDVEIDAAWNAGSATEIGITPAKAGELAVRSAMFTPGFFTLTDSSGAPVEYTLANNTVTFAGTPGERYIATAELAVSVSAPASATTGDTVEATVQVSAIGSTAITAGRLDITVPTVAEGAVPWAVSPASIDLPLIPAGETHSETVSITVGTGNETRLSPIVATLTSGEAQVSSTTIISVKPATPCPVPETTGTLLAWDLGADPLTDASGNNVIPTVVGTAPKAAEGPTGSSQSLGTLGYVSSVAPVSLGYLEEATFAGEFKIDPGQNSHRRLFDTQPVGNDAEGILIDLTPSNNVRIITAGVGTTTNVVVPTGQWFDLAVTINTGGLITVYLNGKANAGNTISSYQAVNACTARTFHIGANRGGEERQKGLVDRVAVFPKALSAAEVTSWQKIAFGTVGRCPVPAAEGTLLAWHLGDSAATDNSGHNRTPSVTGAGTRLEEGPDGTALSLDGTTYVSSPVTSLGWLPAASFAAEVKIASGQDSHRRLFDFQPDSTNWDGIIIDTRPNNEIRVITAGAEPVNTGVILPTDTWVDLVLVIAETGDMTAYVDGVAKAAGSIPNYTAIDACNQRPLRFGADQTGGQRQRGAVDHVAIFPRALDATSAANWKQLAFGPTTPEPVAATITGITPASGTVDGGTGVTVTGTGFLGTTGVTFGGEAAASFTVASDTELTAVSPAHSAATVDLVVVGPAGNSNAASYEFTADPVLPDPATVTSITPAKGLTTGGTAVTIVGSGFTGAESVHFGDSAALDLQVVSDTEIRATSPARSAGTVSVTVTVEGTTSNGVDFLYEVSDGGPVEPGGPGEQPTEPGNPATDDQFTDATKGAITSPATAPAGSQIVIGVGTAHANTWVSVWLHSSPAHLGWRLVDASGYVTATLPLDQLGDHRLAVLDLDGAMIGWNPIAVFDGATGNGPGGAIGPGESAGGSGNGGNLATTGLVVGGGILAALAALVAGGVLLLVRRRASAN